MDQLQFSQEAQLKLNKPQTDLLEITMETKSTQVKCKGRTHHPNPVPGLPSHFSSLDNLQRYIDDQLLELRCQLHLPELEYRRDEFNHKREQQFYASKAALPTRGSPSPLPSSSASSQPPSQTISAKDPRRPELKLDCNVAAEPQSNHRGNNDNTAGGRFISSYRAALNASAKSRIEVYIPSTILELPIGFRPTALKQWYTYVLLTQPELRTTLLEPQRRAKSGPAGMMTPWDKGVGHWSGSFDERAVEIMKREGGRFTKIDRRVVEVRQRDRGGSHEKGEDEGMEWFERSARGGETWDVLDGHVLGMDWACDRGGAVMLVHEEERATEKRKDSVLDKMVGVMRRALSAQ